MENFSVQQVCKVLKDYNAPEAAIHVIQENDIDGDTLLYLIKDFEEFHHVMPQSGVRIKVKNIVAKFSKSDQSIAEISSDLSTVPSCSTTSSLNSTVEHITSFSDPDENFDEDQEIESIMQGTAKKPKIDVYSPSDSDEAEDEEPKKTTNFPLPLAVKKEIIKEDPLPEPFPLPTNFRADVEIGLTSGAMSKEAKRQFFSSVAASMFTYKKWPTGEEYIRVAQQLIAKYPFLKPPTSRSSVKAIKDTLSNRFKEFRRPPKSRQSTSTSTSASKSTNQKSPSVDILMTTPEIPPGEDATSFRRHNNLLITESKKCHPNMLLVNDCMKKSFEMRRKDLLTELYTINAIFERYPFLRRPDQLCMDMQRILSTERLRTTVHDGWTECWGPRIMKQAEIESTGCKAVASTLESLDNKLPISSLVILSYLLPDARIKPNHKRILSAISESCDIVNFIKEKGQKEPYVVVVGTFKAPKQSFLIIDGEIVDEIELQNIPLMLLSSFFVFNICYTRGCSNVYTFLEHALFNLQHKKLPPSVEHFLASLQVHT